MMPLLRPSTLCSLIALTLCCLSSCSERDDIMNPIEGGDDSVSVDDGSDVLGSDTTMDTSSTDDGMVMPGTNPDNSEPYAIWAHSSDTLYRFDPDTLQVAKVDVFRKPDGEVLNSVLDIAVSSTNRLVIIADSAIWDVNEQNAQVSMIVEIQGLDEDDRLNALSFIEAGGLSNESEEILVAGTLSEILRIDMRTGALSTIATLPPLYITSGDIVSVKGAGTFATLKNADGENPEGDILAQINPNTGSVFPIDFTGFSKIFGVGYWKGDVFGFTDQGELIRIDVVSGEATLLSDSTGAERFWGAAVSTNAPLL